MPQLCILTDNTAQFPVPVFPGRNLVQVISLHVEHEGEYFGKSEGVKANDTVWIAGKFGFGNHRYGCWSGAGNGSVTFEVPAAALQSVGKKNSALRQRSLRVKLPSFSPRCRRIAQPRQYLR